MQKRRRLIKRGREKETAGFLLCFYLHPFLSACWGICLHKCALFHLIFLRAHFIDEEPEAKEDLITYPKSPMCLALGKVRFKPGILLPTAPRMHPAPAPSPHPAPVLSSPGVHPSATADLRWCPGALGRRGLSLGPPFPLAPHSVHYHRPSCTVGSWPTGSPHLFSSALGNASHKLQIALQGLRWGAHLVPLPGALTEPLSSPHAHPLEQQVGQAGLGSPGSFKEKQGHEFTEQQALYQAPSWAR